VSSATRTLDNSVETKPQAPDAAQLLMQMGSGYMISACLYTATKLGIADLLGSGPQSVTTLSARTHANEDALYRVLRALASVGVFAESERRTFSLTPVSEKLRIGVPGSVREMVIWMANQFHFQVWGDMFYAVTTGKNATEHMYGKPVFECFAPGCEVATEFNDAMTNISSSTVPAVLEHYSFSGIKTLVDIGCGHGYLLCEILSRYPQMKGILFDMEHVVAGAQRNISRCDLGDRAQVKHGTFFEAVPKGGDAYIMQHIIHDWDDEKAITILKNTRAALEGVVDGKLLILDAVIGPGNGPDFKKFLDLEMLLMPGGRERTEAEFRELLARAGFKVTRIVPTPSMVAVIEAVVV
jgi:hypothetical protein